jgi:hypothetical protein
MVTTEKYGDTCTSQRKGYELGKTLRGGQKTVVDDNAVRPDYAVTSEE